MATVFEEIHKIIEQLTPDRQKSVLEFLQRLTLTDQGRVPLAVPTTQPPPGTPASELLKLRFRSSREVGEAMERALKDCERT